MAKNIAWLEGNRIKVDPPKNPKKITGTRFAAILGKNPWATPFEAWCAITRTYEKPFEETIYTRAGKVIEPKQADWISGVYFWEKLVTPVSVFGEDYFRKTRGDFFPESNVFGGMWDYLFANRTDGKTDCVLEMKTSKRVEDWQDDIPEYYALQAALYAYLKGCDYVRMVASFLEPADYENPEAFVCSGKNTIDRPFRVSERYPDFERNYINRAKQWWHDYVLNGISPPYDEVVDAEILKELRKTIVAPGASLADLIAEAEDLKARLDACDTAMEPIRTRYEIITKAIKGAATLQFEDGLNSVELPGKTLTFVISRSNTRKVDNAALKKAGLFEQYSTPATTYRLTVKTKEE